MKSAEEIMEMLEAFDLTRSYRDAGELVGCSHHTVAHYVQAREAGSLSCVPVRRPQLVDEFLPKVEEWVERSQGKVRADVVHDKLVAMGFAGSERTTRRAVAELRRAWRAGNRRVHRPWVVEPGMWLQYDFGDGPLVGGVRTQLFCAWLAWCRFAGGAGVVGQDAAHGDGRGRHHAAPDRWGPDVCADGQRAHGQYRSCRGDRGAQPDDGRVRPP